ncbi:MAG: hypothetical protein M3081_20435 [Gemmatimonadota bacterium]|nr:hypothetical protein [Gemmatimonadota bacterium]
MVMIVFGWILGVTVFCYGWLLAITDKRRATMYALLAIVGVIICAASVYIGAGQNHVVYPGTV